MNEALTRSQLSELHDDLKKLKQQLRQQLENDDSGKPVVLDQQLLGRVSRIDAIQQQQMAKAHHQQMQAQLARIEKSLLAFSEDEYGYCQSCDETISFLRLKVRPDTPFCVKCQERMEQG